MTTITLFAYPGACSRVTLNALEEIRFDYDIEAPDIARGEHKLPAYLVINPKGKVPALRIGARVFTENAAILHYLHGQYPSADLLPTAGGNVGINQTLEDLVWCSSTLHPMTRQVRMPMRYTAVAPEAVRADGIEKYQPVLADLESRLSGGRWWYGKVWSILDVYLYWNYSTAASGGLDLSAAPSLADHQAKVRGRASFVRSLAREMALVAERGLQLPPGATL